MKTMKAYLNVLKFRLNLKFKRTVVHNFPFLALIEPNLFCNLHCPACPTVSINEGLFQTAIDEVGDYLFQLYLSQLGRTALA